MVPENDRSSKVIELQTNPKVGRAWQHAEDLIIVHGAEGALFALDNLESMSYSVDDVRIKWDGSPAIYFGRNQNGEFFLTDKSGYMAKTYDGKAKTSQELKTMLLNRSKTVDSSRHSFVSNMAELFKKIEAITDPDFRGSIFADVLFFERPNLNLDNEFEFTPNTVTYHINASSNLGQQIARSTVGIVIHQFNGIPIMDKVEGINNCGSVFIVSHVPIENIPRINIDNINRVRQMIMNYRDSINSVLDDQTLAEIKLSDLKNILYKFVNSQVLTESFDDLNTKFNMWLPSSGVSKQKKFKIEKIKQNYPEVFPAILGGIEMIMQIKDDIINCLDKSNPIKQTINGALGGEGYIKGNIKLVSRLKFTAANFKKHS